MSSLDDLDPEQRTRIEQFKEKHGKEWQSNLSELWWSGKDDRETNGHLLRQIRNRLGPTWLSNLPSDGAKAKKK